MTIAAADREPWSSLDGAVINTFRRINVSLRYHLILPHRATLEQIRRILKSVNSVSRQGKYLIPLRKLTSVIRHLHPPECILNCPNYRIGVKLNGFVLRERERKQQRVPFVLLPVIDGIYVQL